MENKHDHSHHHILPTKVAFAIGGALLFLTLVTVWVAGIDLGKLNFVVAMAIATVKALLVCLFFMNLLYDRRENGVIFGTSFLFLAIFLTLTSTDLFFRGDIYVKGPLMAATNAPSKFKKPWISTPELIAHGKELFQVNCVTCHGPNGKGDGVAAAALNPHPRNFTSDAGWVNGRKPSQVFKTLKEGIPGSAMASFATLPADDRWSLAAYVLSLGPKAPTDTPADLAKIGVDASKETAGGGEESKSIPMELAMSRMAQPEVAPPAHSSAAERSMPESAGGKLYQTQCASCHGMQGEGMKVRNLGVNPVAFVQTRAFKAANGTVAPGLESFESFSHVVIQGLPGNLMPGYGSLSGNELHELYDYSRSLPAAR